MDEKKEKEVMMYRQEEQLSVLNKMSAPIRRNRFTDEDAEKLDQMYADERYADFLSCECWRRLGPDRIPLNYMEKALTAARRLIFSPEEDEVQLNPFQQKLLQADKNFAFSGWIADTRYDDDIVEQCGATMMLREKRYEITKMLNDVIYTKSCNGQYLYPGFKKYKGLISRFQAVRNEQLLPLYVVGAFAQTDQRQIEELIGELCRFIIKSNESGWLRREEGEAGVLYLPSVLRGILQAPGAREISLGSAVQTLILAAFVTTFRMRMLDRELAEILFPDENGVHRLLIGLMEHHETWDKEKFRNLLRLKPNPHLLENCLALIWGEAAGQSGGEEEETPKLPGSFLRLLGWLVTYCDRKALESVMDCHAVRGGENLSRSARRLMLLRALPDIRALAAEDPACCNLGAYLANFLYEEFKEYGAPELTTPDIAGYVDDWKSFSQSFFETRIPPAAPLTPERRELYAELFCEYRQDSEHELLLQQMYEKELLDVYRKSVPDRAGTEELLAECFGMGAFRAYASLYREALGAGLTDPEEGRLDNYVRALIWLESFDELIDFLLSCPDLEEEKRDAFLIETVCGVLYARYCRPDAFAVFDDRFTAQDAVRLLEERLDEPHVSLDVVTALIALYIHQEEFFRARYLYEIFHVYAEKGNTRIYAQFQRIFARKTSGALRPRKEDNHYNVIQTACNALPPQKLLKFLSWAGGIRIPNRADYNPKHAHILSWRNLLTDPYNAFYWEKFLENLSARLAQFPGNAWMMCVCDGILSDVMNRKHGFDIRHAYELVLEQMQGYSDKSPESFRFALLPYIFSYIIRENDEQLCRLLCETISDGHLRKRLAVRGPWVRYYEDSITAFSAYCTRKKEETGSAVYSDFLKIMESSDEKEGRQDAAHVTGIWRYLGALKNFLFRKRAALW